MLKSKQITPLEVYAYYFYKTCEVDLATNAVMDYCPESFDLIVKYEDDDSLVSEKPLAGIAISVKEVFAMVGHCVTYGYLNAAKADRKCQKNHVVIDLLIELGAVIFVRSSVPETCAT